MQKQKLLILLGWNIIRPANIPTENNFSSLGVLSIPQLSSDIRKLRVASPFQKEITDISVRTFKSRHQKRKNLRPKSEVEQSTRGLEEKERERKYREKTNESIVEIKVYRELSFPRADNQKFRTWRVEGEFTGKFANKNLYEKRKKEKS